MKIGIVGNGFVGKATQILKTPQTEVIVYDINPELCKPFGTTIEHMADCKLVFICVPTPDKNGRCYTGIVQTVVQELQAVGCQYIIIRSTVPPGTSDSLGTFFMPEFLTERNYLTDFENNKHCLIIVHSIQIRHLFAIIVIIKIPTWLHS